MRKDGVYVWICASVSRGAAALGCILGAIACAGCATSNSQSASVLTGISVEARTKDYKATSEYLYARAEAIRTTMAAVPLNVAGADAVIARARSECAGSLRGTPAVAVAERRLRRGQVALATVVLLEGIEAGVVGWYTAATGQQVITESAAHTLSEKVALLHWANPRITNLVRALVRFEAQLLLAAPVNVCLAIRDWAASGYKSPLRGQNQPASHAAVWREWRRALRAVGCRFPEPPIQRTLLAVLHPYERPGSALTTRQIETMEAHLGAAAARADRGRVEALMRVLGGPPRPRKRAKKKLTVPRPAPDCARLK
jgi:hypothetical protein